MEGVPDMRKLAMRKRARRWFLPETPPVLEMLHQQFDATQVGVEALARWAAEGGPADEAQQVRDAEHVADDRKRELRVALRESFSTPLDREDLYLISERLDNVMNGAKDVVRESEIMDIPPDDLAANMARLLAQGVGHLDLAVELLLSDGTGATVEADAATKCQRRLERVVPPGHVRPAGRGGPPHRDGAAGALPPVHPGGRQPGRRGRTRLVRGGEGVLTDAVRLRRWR